MEHSQLETLRSLASLFPLTQNRPRRLLKSETFATMVRMQSLFHDDPRLTRYNKVAEEVPERGLQNGKDEEGRMNATEPDSLKETTCSTSLETEILRIQKEAQCFVGSENSMNDELIQDVVNGLGISVEDGKKKADDDHAIDMDVETEKEKGFNNTNNSVPKVEAVVSSWAMDSMFECLMNDEKDDERSLNEQKFSDETLKDDSMELEKFLSGSNLNDLSHKNVVDEEMEEGEIMHEVGDLDQPLDSFHEEAGLSENMKNDEALVFESTRNVEPLTSSNTNDIIPKDLMSNESMLEKGRNLSFDHEKEANIKKADNHETVMPHKYDNQESGIRILEESVADNPKKRKRGPQSKKNKKRKERIKRAENNRRLGVKRLKIAPISKPKEIVYCRHFLMGRCHEGENCKFSHDTVPLTKSQPCCHFARHACMKGDDCPYDHELSKYPCNTYVSKGYCSRGTECLFSHQVPPMNHSSETTTPKLKPSGLLENKGSQKQSSAPSRKSGKADAETVLKQSVKGIDKLLFGITPPRDHSTGDNSNGHCMESNGRKALTNPSSNAVTESRRINFLSFGKSPVNDLKTNGILKDDVGTNITAVASSLLQKEGVSCQKEMLEKPNTQRSLPRGINFMSFGVGQPTASQNMNIVDKKILQTPIFTESEKGLNSPASMPPAPLLAVAASSLLRKEKVSCQNKMPEKTSTQRGLPSGINFMSFGTAQKASQDANVVTEKVLQMPISTESQNLTVDIGQDLPVPASKPAVPLPSTSTLGMNGQRSISSQNALLSMLAFADKYKSKIKKMVHTSNGASKEI